MFFVPFLLLALIVISCVSTEVSNSEDVNQNKIYQKYAIRCYAGDKASAEAVFRFASIKGNSLVLNNPASIKINENKMWGDKVIFRGYVYKNTIQLAEDAIYTYEYTDADKKKYINSIAIRPVEFRQKVYKITRGETNKIEVQPTQVKFNESLKLKLTINDTSTISITAPTGNLDLFTIRASQLNGIARGGGTMQLTRSVKEKLQDKTASGGQISGSYYSERVNVELVD